MTVRMRAPERLTRSEAGEMERARRHLVALVAAAGTLVRVSGHEPDRVGCQDAGCGLTVVPDGAAWCRLAQRLGVLDVGAAQGGEPDTGTDLDRAVSAFGTALVASLDAVRACRSIGHVEGRCWFAATSGVDGCGEVLRAAHRVG